MDREQCHLPGSVHVLLAMNHVKVHYLDEQDFGQLELGCDYKVSQGVAGHVTYDHVVPDTVHVVDLGREVCDCVQVVSAQHYLVAVDSSHTLSVKMPSHVRSDTDHAPCGQGFDHVLDDKKSGLGSDSVLDSDYKFSDLHPGPLVFYNYQVIPETGCAGLNPDVGLAGLDTDRARVVIRSDLFCLLEEEVSDSGHVVFPKARAARTECDTVRAPQHDHVGCPAGCCWLWFRELNNE